MLALIEDAGFIYGGYALTFATVGFFAWRTLTQGRKLGKHVPDDEKYWT